MITAGDTTETTIPKVAERDYFPCCWCETRFQTTTERFAHELGCKVADADEAAILEQRHLDVANALLAPAPGISEETERCIARHSDVKPLTVHFSAKITQAQLADMMRMAGIALYPCHDGSVGARSIEEHRSIIEQNRKSAQVRHYQDVEAEARAHVGARYRPFTCKNMHANCSTKVYGNCDKEPVR